MSEYYFISLLHFRMYAFTLTKTFIFYFKPKVRSDCNAVCVVLSGCELAPLVFMLTKNGKLSFSEICLPFVYSDFNMDDAHKEAVPYFYTFNQHQPHWTRTVSKSGIIEEKIKNTQHTKICPDTDN